ncbi:glycoside hydrolase family 3 C-terminal domain-containing protein [Eubacteriales bacterium OttesenSCG-928-N14]|nr:glycoside hydrolase family 3 C-terminal domain-containing protein [Eubacteriales bacterium OttesenSCG-928-N14]
MGNGYTIIKNDNGPDLGISESSGMRTIEVDGLHFKDYAGNGQLLPYADWRLSDYERAQDLVGRMSIEQMAGLMLYSSHQNVPMMPGGYFMGHYDGKDFPDSGADASDLTDEQKQFLSHDHIRHVLALKLENAEVAAKWVNNLQSFVEALPLGIPVSISTDPRHGAAKADMEYKAGGGKTSVWPEGLGMSATFNPDIVRRFGQVAAKEYRALGITTALSPQIDLATEPRWKRFGDTFGEHAGMAADMARAYCEGMQETEGSEDGWGQDSINVMAKHWPGGAPVEGGRDAHYPYGKYAVYPGNNFEEHLLPFTQGALKLSTKTSQAAALMPYYSACWNIGLKENVGNSYSKYIVADLLRNTVGYDGIVCTDWDITGDHGKTMTDFGSRCWGVEHLSVAERHLRIILNGVDQFGGNDDVQPVLEAYRLGCEQLGEAAMRKRFEQSAIRLLMASFRCGLFENPYLDVAQSATTVGHADFVQEGYAAQLQSLVLLKNKDHTLPLAKKAKVYVPHRHIGSYSGFYGNPLPPQDVDPVHTELFNRYFTRVDTPQQADAALVFVQTPINDCYSEQDVADGGNGYLPVTLQFRPYTATNAREVSISGGDPVEDFTNRSYRGKTAICANEQDLDNVLAARQAMGEKPVIVIAQLNKPTVLAEFEAQADAIVVDFGVQLNAVLQTLCGENEPSGLLPLQIPLDMDAVETQCEDVPFDMVPYTDTQGNVYDFGFGLNWQGVIEDARKMKYHK